MERVTPSNDMRTSAFIAFGAAVSTLCLSGQAATYFGNGNTGFGGPVGQGSLTLTDDGTTVSGTFTKGSGAMNDVLVLYVDSVPGGFSTTANFTDNADGLRRAISGYDAFWGRSTLTMPSGFYADYAIALGPSSDNYGGLWQLQANASHNFINSVNLNPTGNNSASTYTFSFAVSDIGLTPGSGESFGLFGTLISNTAYRSDEALPGNVSGSQGWNPFASSGDVTYTIATVPEPSTLALLSLPGLAALFHIRRRNIDEQIGGPARTRTENQSIMSALL